MHRYLSPGLLLQCSGQSSVTEKSVVVSLFQLSSDPLLEPRSQEKPFQINNLRKTIKDTVGRVISFPLQTVHRETGHLPNHPASCLRFSTDALERKSRFVSL